MKIDLSEKIKDPTGHEIKEAADSPSLTLGIVCLNAFMAVLPGDEKASIEDKVKTYKMACQLATADGKIELSAEDVSFIKRRVGAAYHHIVAGAALVILD